MKCAWYMKKTGNVLVPAAENSGAFAYIVPITKGI